MLLLSVAKQHSLEIANLRSICGKLGIKYSPLGSITAAEADRIAIFLEDGSVIAVESGQLAKSPVQLGPSMVPLGLPLVERGQPPKLPKTPARPGVVRCLNNKYSLYADPRKGGMAEVYKARDDNDRLVAVKLFSGSSIESDLLAEVIERERTALKELRHHRIVELLDFGTDQETGQYFLVLEWMETDLSTKLGRPWQWDAFVQQVGLPLLEALAFAHSQGIVHRDVKPNNLLIDAKGKLKLGDFSISKLKHRIAPGITLAEFGSRPFTPPEYDDGSYTFSRDVFSFAVVALACLTNADLADYESVNQALGAANLPKAVHDLLKRSLSHEPAERPANAAVLLTEFRQAIGKVEKRVGPHRICNLTLSPTAEKTLRRELNCESQEEIEEAVIKDLMTEPTIRRKEFKNGVPDGDDALDHFELLGQSFRYHAKVNHQGTGEANSLFICSAIAAQSSLLEKDRARSWNPPVEFRFGRPQIASQAQQCIEFLQRGIEEFAEEQASAVEKEEELRLFRTWWNVLDAKTQVELRRTKPLPFVSVKVEGKRGVFELTAMPEGDPANLIDRTLMVRLPNGKTLNGEVDEIRGRNLILYFGNGDPSLLPRTGELLTDSVQAEKQIDRQRRALDAVRFNRATRKDVASLILHPETCKPPLLANETHSFHENLDDDKKRAINAAVGCTDFMVVEGPPGTGKTTFLSELVSRIIYSNPDARILLASQTHVAVDNALERMDELDLGLKLVRIGRLGDHGASEVVERLHIDNQMESWRNEVLNRSDQFLERIALANGVSKEEIEVATLFEDLAASVGRLSILATRVECRRQEIAELQNRQATEGSVRQGEIDSLQSELKKFDDELTTHQKKVRDQQHALAAAAGLELHELQDLTSDELLERSAWFINRENPAHVRYQKLRRLHLDWTLRFGRGDGFQSAFLKRSQVVAGTCVGFVGAPGTQGLEFDLCVIDEASKATATEALVPVSRSRCWILVGDEKQLPPFVDEALRDDAFLSEFSLTRDDLKQTLFGHLSDRLLGESKQSLLVQHRMIREIGDFISHCFYGGRLQSPKTTSELSLDSVFPRPVTWFSTSRAANRFETQRGTSFVNPFEAKMIVKLLSDLNAVASTPANQQAIARTSQKALEVAVLSGYGAQRNELAKLCAAEQGRWPSLKVECYTVDSFQGREADVAFYSVTRSNNDGRIGHLRERERLNVALSRSRFGLGIVGDQAFCESAQGENPFSRIVEYIKRHSNDCTIREWHP